MLRGLTSARGRESLPGFPHAVEQHQRTKSEGPRLIKPSEFQTVTSVEGGAGQDVLPKDDPGLAPMVAGSPSAPSDLRLPAARDDGRTLTQSGDPAALPAGVGDLFEVGKDEPNDSGEIPPSILDRYDSITLLGRGGMGVVYRANDRFLNRIVALKFLYGGPRIRQELLKEARSQARVDHENACKVYEVGLAEGRHYIVMQYIDGEPLDQAKARMTLEEKVRVIRLVAPALHEAHRLGLIHRDVKPSNILVERGEDGAWKPYITDFGIARDLGEAGQTMTGTIAGTPAFMAPEQARGDIRALDRRTDVYSLGATLFAILTGKPPFDAGSTWELLQKVTLEDAPPARKMDSRIPKDIEAILMKCLEKDPSRRYDSAKALGEDLQHFLDGDPVSARRLSIHYILLKRARKHKALVAIACAALVSGLVLVSLWVRASRLAAQQATLARELGEDVKEMELFLRSAYGLPLHDVEREKDVVRTRLRGIEERIAAMGSAGEGPGHYALGRGHLALQEPDKALEHLKRASASGYSSPDLDYAMGLSLGELYRSALEETKRIENPERKKARIAEIHADFKEPALRHLRAAAGARLEAPAYIEGLIALYDGDYELALSKARDAYEKAPWLYEAKKLEGDAHFADGSRFRHDADFDYEKMMSRFRLAAEAYASASEAGRSDPRVHEAECELWVQVMNSSFSREDAIKPSFEKADAACAKALRASSRNTTARIKRALAQNGFAWWSSIERFEGDAEDLLEKTIEDLNETAQRIPGNAMGPYLLGAARRTQAFYLLYRGLDSLPSSELAIASYEEARSLDPTFLWVLNELCGAHWLRLVSKSFRGSDPRPEIARAVDGCDRAMKLEPGFLYPYNNKAYIYLVAASYLVEMGRRPDSEADLAAATALAAKARSPGWVWGSAIAAKAFSRKADYRLGAGEDPRDALASAAKHVEEAVKADPSSSDTLLALADLAAQRARYLAQSGGDPEPALRDARAAWSKLIEARSWDITYPIGRARVEIQSLRITKSTGEAALARIDAGLRPLLDWLDKERSDPHFYQTMAELYELRAATLPAREKEAGEDLSKGLAMAAKALALNPKMARALATKGALLIGQARGLKGKEARREIALQASEALSAAVRENPLLERERKAELESVKKMLAYWGGGVPK